LQQDKIKVLHVYKSFFPETIGGVEQYISGLCSGTKKYGIESRVLCLGSTNNQYSYNGILVKRVKYDLDIASCPLSLRLLLSFRKESKWADIIHYHYPWPFGDFLSLFVPKNKKQIVTYHSDIVKQKLLRILYYPLEQYFLSKVDKIIATSPNYIDISRNLKKFAAKSDVIPISIDHTKFLHKDIEASNKIRKKFGDKFILFIGQLRYYKGLHLLINAMKGLESKLVIIGDGKEKAPLRHLCEENKINNVHFVNRVTDKEKVDFLHASYCFVLPSHLKSEAFGIALLEAAAAGKPLISCKIGTGTEYINQHMETGLVVPPKTEEIRNAIKYLILNPRLATAMGGRAQKRVETLFSSDRISGRLALMYKGLVG